MWNYSVLLVIVKWQHLNMYKENRKNLGKIPIFFYQSIALFESTSALIGQMSGTLKGQTLDEDTFYGSKQRALMKIFIITSLP